MIGFFFLQKFVKIKKTILTIFALFIYRGKFCELIKKHGKNGR